MATPDGEPVTSEYGYEFDADLAVEDRDPAAFAEDCDLLAIPGGGAPEALRTKAPAAADVVSAFVAAESPWRPSATARSCWPAPTFWRAAR